MVVFVAAVSLVPGRAAAEKVVVNVDGWQIFTDGRAGGFVSHAYGDGYPQTQYGDDPMGIDVVVDTPQEGAGFRSISDSSGSDDPSLTAGNHDPRPGHDQCDARPQRLRLQHLRLRCAGQAHRLDHAVGLHPVLVVHRERRSAEEPPEQRGRAAGLREAGRPLGQLHRRPGARAVLARETDIDVLYAHRWGVGWPGALDNKGPSLGQLSLRRPRCGLFGRDDLRDALARGPAAERRRLRPGSAPGLRQLDAHQVRAPRGGADVRTAVRERLGKIALFANGV